LVFLAKYYSVHEIKEHVARIGEIRNAYEILDEMPQGKRSLGITKWRWGDNIKLDLTEKVCERVDWIHLARSWDQWWVLM